MNRFVAILGCVAGATAVAACGGAGSADLAQTEAQANSQWFDERVENVGNARRATPRVQDLPDVPDDVRSPREFDRARAQLEREGARVLREVSTVDPRPTTTEEFLAGREQVIDETLEQLAIANAAGEPASAVVQRGRENARAARESARAADESQR